MRINLYDLHFDYFQIKFFLLLILSWFVNSASYAEHEVILQAVSSFAQ